MNEGHQYVKGEVSVIDYSYNLLHALLWTASPIVVWGSATGQF